MRIAVCFNQVPAVPLRGEQKDLISEAGAGTEAEAVAAALRLLGHRPTLIPLGAEIAPFVATLNNEQPELIFNFCEGFWGIAAANCMSPRCSSCWVCHIQVLRLYPLV